MCWSTILVSLSEVCLLSWSLLYIYKTADCKLPWSHQSNVSAGSSAAEYYVHNVLRLSPDLNSFGNIGGDILLATVITWVIVAVCLSAGIRKTGRLCYAIAPLILVATVVLFIQGCLLWDSRVSAALSPDWVHLTVPQTWLAASVYVYHSLNLGRGGLTTIGSFNKEHTNLIRDVGLLCLVHFAWGITLWLTFVCFTLGNGLQLEPYAGPWLLFVSVAKGLAALPHGVPFALLTYSLVFISGLSTLAGNILMVISSVLAIFPRLQSQRSAVTATTCLGIFLLGIPLTSQIGLHLYWLLIHYAVSWVPVLHGLCVVLVVALCYGHVQFVADLGYSSGIYLKEWVARHLIVVYSSLLPILLLVLLASTLHIASHFPTRQSTYPDWGVALGWLLTALPLFVLLFSGAAYKLLYFLKKHSFRKSLMLLVKPDEMWIHNTFRTGSRVSEKTTMTHPVIIAACKEYDNNNLSSYIDRNLQHGDREQDSFDL
ncbi:sodium- and chloride-dependent GABA transporter 2-like [Anabrus simplex]|uniref:sodium- and chloride-dependent GABA transporter 2-like n=1 Tax=Anabrus simplex TaxID=316456 RepID=UPI0035A2EDBE